MRPDKTVAPLRKVYVLFVFFAASGAKHQRISIVGSVAHVYFLSFSRRVETQSGDLRQIQFIFQPLRRTAHLNASYLRQRPIAVDAPFFSFLSSAKKGSRSVGGGMNFDVGALPGKFILQMSGPWSLWRKWSGTWKIGADGSLFLVGIWAMTPTID